MTKDDNGVWSIIVGPLPPQMYGYWYMVDGVRALDPSNSETERDGSRYNAMLMISGLQSALWDFKDVPHGTLEQVWYPFADAWYGPAPDVRLFAPGLFAEHIEKVSRTLSVARRWRR